MRYEVVENRTAKGIVRVHKPILSAKEREEREQEVRKALVQFWKETRGIK